MKHRYHLFRGQLNETPPTDEEQLDYFYMQALGLGFKGEKKDCILWSEDWFKGSEAGKDRC